MAVRDVVLFILGIGALYGLYATLKDKGAAAALGVMALAGFVGYLVQSADDNRLAHVLSPTQATSQPAVPHSSNITPNREIPQRTYVDGGSSPPTKRTHKDRMEVESAPERVPAPAQSLPEPADAHARGGVQILVEGSWGPLGEHAVESAMRAALQQTGWEGLQAGGRKVLRIRGSLEDRSLTLGQIPTAAANLSWTLSLESGAVLGEGGLLDLQGTGVDATAARTAAIRRAASRVAGELSQ